MPGRNINILEALEAAGGLLDGAVSPAGAGYLTRGGRMLDDEAYRCLRNLLETIPDRDDPAWSAREVITDFNLKVPTQARARLIGAEPEILDAAACGFSTRDRAELPGPARRRPAQLADRAAARVWSPLLRRRITPGIHRKCPGCL